ncbi:MAG TPA: XTP/dITP diphosphatase [Desulfotomaculum sp.]|nr:MAG: purine NTP phosphatase [Desulfotomaculum sp. BICA1-6]HBX23518.1 XTP/dITP diphosphatase [Desulfotomaculum sp.]
MKLVLATRNTGKVKELQELLAGTGMEVISLADFPGVPEVVEDGDTFQANAIKKARQVAETVGEVTLSDDSGLEVDYLGGAPGVISARFAGAQHDDEANNRKLLDLLSAVPWEKRTGRFRCVVALAVPDGTIETVEGTCEGIITTEPKGDQGFGYDPLFFVPEYEKTFAELNAAEKNLISHRGKALTKALDVLKRTIAR